MQYLHDILEELTGDDVRHLIQAEDELTVIGNFERIFPTKYTHDYLQYMEMRYYNRLFDAWESKYEDNRKPGEKFRNLQYFKAASGRMLQKYEVFCVVSNVSRKFLILECYDKEFRWKIAKIINCTDFLFIFQVSNACKPYANNECTWKWPRRR